MALEMQQTLQSEQFFKFFKCSSRLIITRRISHCLVS